MTQKYSITFCSSHGISANNCGQCFAILGGAWESTITFFTFNLKASTALPAPVSRLAEYYLDVCKVLFQKTGTNTTIISHKEQEQTSYLLTLSQKKQQLLHLQTTFPRFSVQPVLFHSSMESPLEKEWDSHEISSLSGDMACLDSKLNQPPRLTEQIDVQTHI